MEVWQVDKSQLPREICSLTGQKDRSLAKRHFRKWHARRLAAFCMPLEPNYCLLGLLLWAARKRTSPLNPVIG